MQPASHRVTCVAPLGNAVKDFDEIGVTAAHKIALFSRVF